MRCVYIYSEDFSIINLVDNSVADNSLISSFIYL